MKFKRLLFTLLSLCVSFTALNARELYSLNDGWRVFSSDEGNGDAARSISLPYCWSQSLSTPVSLTSSNYLRNLYVPNDWRGKRLFVKFYGVQSVADLFVNGRHVGEHRGGATAFVFEITDRIKYDDDNVISVRVSSAPQSDLLPTSVEHEIYGGIYRDVELIVTPSTAVSPVFYGSDGIFVTTKSIEHNSVSGEVEVRFVSDLPVERRLELTFVDKNGVERFRREINKSKISNGSSLTIPFTIKGADLWSPSTPNLYRATLCVKSVEKGDKEMVEQMDQVSVTTGFRVVSIADSGDVKGIVSINGEPILMRGVSLYHDHPSNGGVLTNATYEQDIAIVKDLGANAIRSAVVPHDNYLYSLCDRDGIMVWVDTPLSRSSFFSDVAYFPTKRFEENGLEQLREIIYQNYNHPSVMMWGIFSMLSSRGDDVVRYLNELNSTAKKIDPNRPTVALSNQNGDMNSISDLIVWRQNIGWDRGSFKDVEVWRDKLHTEWGNFKSGVMYGEGGAIEHQINREDIVKCREENRLGWFPEGRQSVMHEDYSAALGQDSLFWGLWMPSLFDYKSSRSVIGENKDGLVCFNRENRKDVFYLYRALWNKESPTLYIADRRARFEGNKRQTLRVYSSDTIAPIAYVGGDSMQMKNVAPAQYVLEGIDVLNRTKVVVTQGDLADSIELIYASPLRARER